MFPTSRSSTDVAHAQLTMRKMLAGMLPEERQAVLGTLTAQSEIILTLTVIACFTLLFRVNDMNINCY